jgi:hypothetical protein
LQCATIDEELYTYSEIKKIDKNKMEVFSGLFHID